MFSPSKAQDRSQWVVDRGGAAVVAEALPPRLDAAVGVAEEALRCSVGVYPVPYVLQLSKVVQLRVLRE